MRALDGLRNICVSLVGWEEEMEASLSTLSLISCLERSSSYETAPSLDNVDLPSIPTGQKCAWRRRGN